MDINFCCKSATVNLNTQNILGSFIAGERVEMLINLNLISYEIFLHLPTTPPIFPLISFDIIASIESMV